jgi:hypothetical protein
MNTTPADRARIRKMLAGIDRITDQLAAMEGIICQHCSRFSCEECPIGVVLTDYPKVLCAQRVIEQMAIQSNQRFEKEAKK